MRYIVVIVLLLGLSGIHCALFSQKQEVDLIVHNAKVYTVDNDFSMASAFAVHEGKFIAVGDKKEILKNYSSESVFDADGSYIYPGFNDGHSHFIGYGLWVSKYADLVGTASMNEVLIKLKQHDKEFPSDWILGRGWDQNDWEIKEFPTNELLNAAFPDKAVAVTRIDGHAILANDYALKLAGIDSNSEIDGGEILLKDGKPTGVLIDKAKTLLTKFMPKQSTSDITTAILKAQEDCFAVGLTTVSDAGIDKDEVLLIKKLQDEGRLKIAVYAMLDPNKRNFEYFYPQGPLHYPRLTISSIKLYSDGALGSRGALLLEPYSDDPDNYGLQMNSEEYFLDMCQKAYEAGYQVNTHAIGDSGNRMMLQTYAKVLKGKNDKRWRVEHAQIVHTSDIQMFNEFSIIPSVQATHCTSDMHWADERLGEERIKTAYAYNDLLKQLGWLVNGTDFPIEHINPLRTFYASVVRKDMDGLPEEGFQLENALSREDALKSITIWPAKGSFDENTKGSIEVGKNADFVVLEIDLMTAKDSKILNAEVKNTFMMGENVFN